MIKTNFFYSSLLIGGLLTVASCTDDKYDLSDIDTSTAIKLNNLTVPVRLSSITLDDVFDIEEDGLIEKFKDADGNEYYAIIKEGDFSAGQFTIEPIVSEKGPNGINPIYFPNVTIPVEGSVNLPTLPKVSYIYHLSDVDTIVKSVEVLELSVPMEVNLDFTGVEGVEISNLKIQIPEMFHISNYPMENGIVTISKMVAGQNGTLVLPEPIKVDRLDIYTPNINKEMTFSGEIGIETATLTSNQAGITVNPVAQFKMSGFTASSITATIGYTLKDPKLDAVNLNDVPDFLSESGTNLVLQNPQLFIWVSNPTSQTINTTLTINPVRENQISSITQKFTFNRSVGLAPEPSKLVQKYFDEYSMYGNLTPVTFDGLRDVLAGDGLPSRLEFHLDANINGQIDNFNLATPNGEAIDYDLEGKYTFFTPLALGYGSQIIYSQKETDFFGDDMEDVQVDLIQLSANPKTNLPFDVTLTVYPLNKEGNRIGNIKAEGIVKANADGSTPLVLSLKNFTGLDGVEYIVTVDNMTGVTLTPEQYVELNDIRATVSGYYETKL